ncbi:leucine-responsive transcriptional regulator LEU3 NDAI_0D00220 [Naumovozyma dairenensis CBS 421]|uniref:Zn(2)-C6 fungal-type domain-containing protein n=1 Tax=Naumovozyma dairenensis (strain ATCC 10597 / BCRC 20456 / CBS 421 / NBRC 0211 / NRRL Y-12639) TaxID=1071378 RepID=G0W975_NAUDC|nr:hypothetical protein NDAI_0D00220 [Naumovozyma dairenensis CBS 421]CCD24336.1 hypothetical protein NDAI_0D00220 [Naumovozyma dairenensis CBS 421]
MLHGAEEKKPVVVDASTVSISSDPMPNTLVSPSTSASVSSTKKRKFACVECRQQKSKCDAYDKAPDPCTKCQKKGVPCVLKKDFRRTYKRARNEAIEKRFKELTQTLTNLSSEEILKKIEQEQQTLLDNRNFTKEKIKKLRESSSSSTTSLNSFTSQIPILNDSVGSFPLPSNHTTVPKSASPSSSPTSLQLQNLNTLKDFKMTEEQLKCTPKSLGDIYMSSNDIAELFQEFATKYHQFLPVVDLTKGTERIYNLSPALFWVVLLIGLRRKFDSIDLMTRLSILVKSTLAEITISPIIRYTPSDTDEPLLNIASVYSVQSFLLYTFWPPLTSSLSADTSWNTIGTAMFQAIRVGLNCADFSKEYATENSELINENIRTWISCNIVSQIVGSSFGFPPYVSFDHAVMSSTRITSPDNDPTMGSKNNSINEVQNISKELKQMVQIAHFENQIINTMNSNPSNKLGMVSDQEKQPLLHVLSQQLSQLEINLQENNLDDIRKFLLLVAKVHLLTYFFTNSSSTHNINNDNVKTLPMSEIEANFETKRGLVKVYNASINLLTHANEMWQLNPAIIKYFPSVFVLNIWQSACIIGKLVHSSLATVLDITKGEAVYKDAVSLTFNASVLKYDMAYRSSGIMRSIWSLFANIHDEWKKSNTEQNTNDIFTNDFNLGITVKSRMAVSVFFDCLYILKEKCGMAKLQRETNGTQEYKDDDDDDGEEEGVVNDDTHDDEKQEDGISKKRSSQDSIKLSRLKLLPNTKHPEQRARRIIETIPLDPHPINATSRLKGISPSNSPHNQNNHDDTYRRASPSQLQRTNTPSSYSIIRDSQYSQQKQTSEIPPISDDINTPSTNSIPSVFSIQQTNFNDQAMKYISPLTETTGGYNLALQDATLSIKNKQHRDSSGLSESNGNAKESPTSLITNFDNWDSDLVWKDVDILMNEFAFNPTV